MGDRSWLGFGVRARPAENKDDGDDRTTAVRNGDSNNRRSLQRSNTAVPLQRNPHKAPRLPRLSSLMGLNMVAKAHTPPATSFEIAPNYPEIIHQRSESMRARPVSYHEAAHDPTTGIWRKNADAVSDFRYRESDATWHNPSLHQMIETVLCTIMTNGISAPIPSHLNHFVASMIEEFSFQTREMQALQTKIAKLEETRANHAQEYRKTTDEWQDREQNLRLEIKRLECIISDTQEGAESVILARAGSVCNRNDRQAFRAKLDRLSQSHDGKTMTCKFTGKNGCLLMTYAQMRLRDPSLPVMSPRRLDYAALLLQLRMKPTPLKILVRIITRTKKKKKFTRPPY